MFIEVFFTSFCLCFRTNYPSENTEEESVVEDDAELTLRKVEEELIVGVPHSSNFLFFSVRHTYRMNLFLLRWFPAPLSEITKH